MVRGHGQESSSEQSRLVLIPLPATVKGIMEAVCVFSKTIRKIFPADLLKEECITGGTRSRLVRLLSQDLSIFSLESISDATPRYCMCTYPDASCRGGCDNPERRLFRHPSGRDGRQLGSPRFGGKGPNTVSLVESPRDHDGYEKV